MTPTSMQLPRRAFLHSTVLSLAVLALPDISCAGAQTPDANTSLPLFTDTERKSISDYWNASGRYTQIPSPDVKDRVNVTVAGSTWYWTFVQACAKAKKATPSAVTAWQDWWTKRAAYEKAIATNAKEKPANPGPPPDAAVTATGLPFCALYEHIQPTRYTVTFATGDAPLPFVYEDGIDFAKRSAYYTYYRSKTGVMRPGKQVKDYSGDDRKQLDALFAKAGRTDFERRVLQAVSFYEGGFEAINTYDTGFVSIGFLQFIAAIDGTGSLADVLLRYKTDDAQGFYADFHRFGIDVTATPVVVCVDPATGNEVRGPEAVQRIINDKRLTAVFERAGQGDGFRLAQINTARARYWPGDDPVFSTAASAQSAAGTPMATIRISDIVKSEAGMATLMDRKVNKGNIRMIADVATQIMREKNITDPYDLARYEYSLIHAMKFRGDFLADSSLSQPSPDSSDDDSKPAAASSAAPKRRK